MRPIGLTLTLLTTATLGAYVGGCGKNDSAASAVVDVDAAVDAAPVASDAAPIPVAPDGGAPEGGRTFFMGSSPFFATQSAFPDFRFDYLVDVDLLSLHVDDFFGVPWSQLEAGTALPSAWTAKWSKAAAGAATTGKPIFLTVSPLGDRKTLARAVSDDGATSDRWAPADAAGCYLFASDPLATKHRDAYLKYLDYVIDLVKPTYLAPAAEINVVFTKCPAQKAAWLAWLGEVVRAVKASHPSLVVFPTVQLEHLYGVADKLAECPGLTPTACFEERLPEIAALPGDRLAFSVYPAAWGYLGQTLPSDTFAKVQAATSKRIWISETGWPAARILSTYGTTPAGCGPELVPSSFASDANLGIWVDRLLREADARQFEAVVWWESRDSLDGAVAETCPCQGTSDTCALASAFRSSPGGATAETLLRMFGNMGLVRNDGTARGALATWNAYRTRARVP
ncbi:MAG: hypothetical protein U0235_03415 [Polyangiaceae bacterium]